MSAQTVKRVVVTLSVAAITATGAWYGAGLKTRQEYKQASNIAVEASPAEKLQQMEMVRAKLVQQKSELQSKIDRFSAKAAAAKDEALSSPEH